MIKSQLGPLTPSPRGLWTVYNLHNDSQEPSLTMQTWNNLVGNWRTVHWDLLSKRRAHQLFWFQLPSIMQIFMSFTSHFSCPFCNTIIKSQWPNSEVRRYRQRGILLLPLPIPGLEKGSSWDPVYHFRCLRGKEELPPGRDWALPTLLSQGGEDLDGDFTSFIF